MCFALLWNIILLQRMITLLSHRHWPWQVDQMIAAFCQYIWNLVKCPICLLEFSINFPNQTFQLFGACFWKLELCLLILKCFFFHRATQELTLESACHMLPPIWPEPIQILHAGNSSFPAIAKCMAWLVPQETSTMWLDPCTSSPLTLVKLCKGLESGGEGAK